MIESGRVSVHLKASNYTRTHSYTPAGIEPLTPLFLQSARHPDRHRIISYDLLLRFPVLLLRYVYHLRPIPSNSFLPSSPYEFLLTITCHNVLQLVLRLSIFLFHFTPHSSYSVIKITSSFCVSRKFRHNIE